jgi:hypothetical protein
MSKKATPQLSNVPLFKSLPADELAEILQSYKSWNAPKGSLVLEEGHSGSEFDVILQG